jgi:predicted dehydrogenase
MKFGVLGCRHAHIEIFIREMLDLGHELIGICERVPDIAKALADKYGAPLLDNEKEFFDRKPQVVGTSAVNNEKIRVIVACREHGVHVIADKPIVTNMEDFHRLKKIMDEGAIEVGLMLTERFSPPIYTLKKMIQEGVLGELISFSTTKPHRLNEKSRAPWHFSKAENGGIVIDLLIHDFDLLRWFTGSDTEEISGYVKKSAYKKYPDFYDSVHTVVKMKDGTIATLEADWWTPDGYWSWGDGRIFCTGTLGKAEIFTTGVEDHREPCGRLVTKDKGIYMFENIKPPVTITEDFLNRIEGKKNVIITGKDILDATLDTLKADTALTRIVL